jgi:hypothetical protein
VNKGTPFLLIKIIGRKACVGSRVAADAAQFTCTAVIYPVYSTAGCWSGARPPLKMLHFHTGGCSGCRLPAHGAAAHPAPSPFASPSPSFAACSSALSVFLSARPYSRRRRCRCRRCRCSRTTPCMPSFLPPGALRRTLHVSVWCPPPPHPHPPPPPPQLLLRLTTIEPAGTCAASQPP